MKKHNHEEIGVLINIVESLENRVIELEKIIDENGLTRKKAWEKQIYRVD